MPTIEELNAALPDNFVIQREIHWGGQRIVYEVTVDAERRVLKLMSDQMRNRAEREVAIGQHFDHPNLSRILETDLQDVSVNGSTYVYFTEEFIEGEPLSAKDQPMEPCEALELAQELISAVTYLWERHHVVHRDIKPLNIMCRPDGVHVLLDIGVARHQGLTTLTVVPGEHQPGTVGYLAPEQLAPLKGREIDYRADLFAIGIVVFEQITGRLPFDPQEDSYRTRLMTGLVTGLDAVISPADALLGRLLAPRPHARFRLDRVAPAVMSVQEDLECF